MPISESIIDAACKKLGINVQAGTGNLFLKKDGVYKSIVDDDFDMMFGFLKKDSEVVCHSIQYVQNRAKIIYEAEALDDMYSTQQLYAS